MSFFTTDPIDRDAARVRTDLLAAPVDHGTTRSAREHEQHQARPMIALPTFLIHAAHRLRASWQEQVAAQERLALINRR